MSDISYQFDEHSCALASLRTLAYLLTKKRGWKNLFFSSHPPYSLKTLEKEMSDLGFDLQFYHSEKEKFSYPFDKEGPFLALLNENERIHMVVITSIAKNEVNYIDPALGKMTLEKEKFLSLWSGVWGVMKQYLALNPPKPKPIVPLWRKILSCSLIFLAEVSLGLGLAFLDKAPLWLSLTCLGSSLLLEEIRRIFVLLSIKAFDKKYISSTYDADQSRMKTNYERFSYVKKNLFADTTSIISEVGSSLFLAVIIGINTPSFFLSLGGVLAILCGEKLIFNRYFSSKMVRMQKEEALIGEKGEEATKRQLLFSLSKDAESYGRRLMLEKAILTMAVAGFAILNSLLVNDSTLNFFLFHLFALFFIEKSGSSIFNYVYSHHEREMNLLYFREYLFKESQ